MSEWGRWIEHDGRHVPQGLYVHAQIKNDPDWEGVAGLEAGSLNVNQSGWLWALSDIGHPVWGCVIRYRIRKPKGLTILEQILNDLPAPTKPTVPA